MKKFTKFEIAAMKRTAANVDQFIRRRNVLQAKKDEIDAELAIVNASIDAADGPTKAMTGGYGSEDLFEKVITDTGKVNKEGTPVKTTKFVLKYPETIIPVEEKCDCDCVEECNAESVVCEEVSEEVSEAANFETID